MKNVHYEETVVSLLYYYNCESVTPKRSFKISYTPNGNMWVRMSHCYAKTNVLRRDILTLTYTHVYLCKSNNIHIIIKFVNPLGV